MRKVFFVGTVLIACAAPASAQDQVKPLDLSTPAKTEHPLATPKAPATTDAKKPSTPDLGTVDLGTSQLRLDRERSSNDLVQQSTGFDQTPGSTTFRSLAPAQKTGTPPYVGFTLTAPR